MPPEAANVCVYAAPTVTSVRGDVVVMVNWSAIVIRNAFVTEFGTPSVVVSVTAMLKLYIPGVVGVPLKTPPDRLNPGGKDPEAREKA
jgi:hypothetical protein